LTGLPEAAQSADLLPPINRRIRSTHADGSFNNNVAYLSLKPQSQAERRTLVANISTVLGCDMKAWHEALHSPKGLPANALDWSTVLLQRTFDLARFTPGAPTVNTWLTGVFQTMETTAPDANTSNWVQAAIDSRHTQVASSSCSSWNASRNAEFKQLQGRVKDLQRKVEDQEFDLQFYAEMLIDESDETGSEMTIQANQDETASEARSVSSVKDAPSLSQDDVTSQDGVLPFEETEEGLPIWADYQALQQYEDIKAELERERLRMEDYITDSSCNGTDQGGSQASASTFRPSPPPPYDANKVAAEVSTTTKHPPRCSDPRCLERLMKTSSTAFVPSGISSGSGVSEAS
jgi:hypothetical protein